MCDSDRVKKGCCCSYTATGDGEWLGGAGAGVLVLLGHYMHPPAPRPHISTIYYLLSTIYISTMARGPDSGKGAGSSLDI